MQLSKDMAKQNFIQQFGSAIKSGIKKILSAGSFEPNYIENRKMPKQSSDFVKKQKAGRP